MARATDRRRHTDAFKRKVVRAHSNGTGPKELAEKYGIHTSLVQHWVADGRFTPETKRRTRTFDALPEKANGTVLTKRRGGKWKFCPHCGEKLQ